MLTPKDTPPFLCDINSADTLDENFDGFMEDDFSHFEELFQDVPLSDPFYAEKGIPVSENRLAGEATTPYRKAIHWPYDLKTGEKLPWGTPLEKGKIVAYNHIHNHWPHNAQTGEKLPWGTPLKKGKVITYMSLKSHWPHDARTGERLPWGTPLEKGRVIIHCLLKNRWPYDAQTGEKLDWGTPLEKGKVISYENIQNQWPHDAQTGEKLPWGTLLEKGKVVSRTILKRNWPHDAQTGEKLSLDIEVNGKNVVSYDKLLKMRPINKLTASKLPYGTKINGDIIETYEFNMDFTFVGSDGKTYKGLNAKEKAAKENPSLSFKSKREIQQKKRRTQTKKQSCSDLAIERESNQKKRSKQSSTAPESSSSCINIPAHQKTKKPTLQFLPLVPEDYNINHEVEQSLEFEPFSPMFLPGLEQQVPTSNDNLHTDIEECGLSPSILFSGPGG